MLDSRVTQIIPSLSKYGPRIVSSAQPGTKYPYLPTYLPTYLRRQIGRRASFRNSRPTLREDLEIHLRSKWFIATFTNCIGHCIWGTLPSSFHHTRSRVLLCILRSFLLHSKCSAFSLSLFLHPCIRICSLFAKKNFLNKIYLFNYNIT